MRAVVGDQALVGQVDLADQHPVAELVEDRAHLGHDVHRLGAVGRVGGQQPEGRPRAIGRPVGVRRVVAQLVVLDEVPHDVDAEPVHAAIQPESQDVVHLGPHVRVAPVEVGLLLEERVIVELARGLVPLPGRAAEHAQPVVGRAAARRGIAPQVPVASRVGAARAGLEEPGVLVRGVVGDEVEQHPDPARVGGLDEAIEVGEGAEDRVDVAVVGDVVAEVGHRRPEDRRDPDGVDAEPLQVLEPGRDAREVADPVAVRVLERARVDLVDDARLPPRSRRRVDTRHGLTVPAADAGSLGA